MSYVCFALAAGMFVLFFRRQYMAFLHVGMLFVTGGLFAGFVTGVPMDRLALSVVVLSMLSLAGIREENP